MELTTHGQDNGLGYLYRVRERWYGSWDAENERVSGSRLELHVEAYPIIKETPKGKWIEVGFSASRLSSDKRFVLNASNKRYAHETKEDALNAFKARRQRQIAILSAQLNAARSAMFKADAVDVNALQCYY